MFKKIVVLLLIQLLFLTPFSLTVSALSLPGLSEYYDNSTSGETDEVFQLAQIKPLQEGPLFGKAEYVSDGSSMAIDYILEYTFIRNKTITHSKKIKNKNKLKKLIYNLIRNPEQDDFVTIYLKDCSIKFLKDLSRSLKIPYIAIGIFKAEKQEIFIFQFTDYRALYEHICSLQNRRSTPKHTAILINGEHLSISDLGKRIDQKVVKWPSLSAWILSALKKIATSL